MSIDFKKTFGASDNNSAPANTRSDQPKAQLWLNIGYDSGVKDDSGATRFVSLPVGIPVDTTEKLATTSRNSDYRAFQTARNDLLDQIMEVGNALQPGESQVLNLQIQLRRVEGEQAPVDQESNQYSKPIQLVG